MKKKGQYALEFLMTYSWALMIIFVIVVIIAYFNIVNPTYFLPESCVSETEFLCREYTAQTGPDVDRLSVYLRNNVGHTINITGVNVVSVDPFLECNVSDPSRHYHNDSQISSNSPSLKFDETFMFNIRCDPGTLPSRDLIKISFEVNHIIDRPGYFPKSSLVTASLRVTDGN